METQYYHGAYTGAQIDAGIAAANAAAPQETTYTKDEVDSMIPDVEHISTQDIDDLFT